MNWIVTRTPRFWLETGMMLIIVMLAAALFVAFLKIENKTLAIKAVEANLRTEKFVTKSLSQSIELQNATVTYLGEELMRKRGDVEKGLLEIRRLHAADKQKEQWLREFTPSNNECADMRLLVDTFRAWGKK
jgi:hypothetical protein